MKLVIDADGCPVVSQCIQIAKENDIKVVLVCDTSHDFSKYDVEVFTVSKGADSADFKIVNMLCKGDIVVTQDYGLASMCLAKQSVCIRQDGLEYNDFNIDSMLSFRHESKKIRNSGGRLKGSQKRNKKVENLKFSEELSKIILRLKK